MEGLNEAGNKRENRNDEEVNDQWPLSTISVGEKTEDNLRRGGVRGIGGRQEGVLTAPTGRNNKVRVMDVVWLVGTTQGNVMSRVREV